MIQRIPGDQGIGAVRPDGQAAELPSAAQGTAAGSALAGSAGGIAGSFRDTLAAAGREQGLELSGHALRRLEERQVDLDGDQLERLRRAMDTLANRGGRQSLVMLDQVAYVVNVPTHTVLTAVPSGARKEAVFTQIDSVVIA